MIYTSDIWLKSVWLLAELNSKDVFDMISLTVLENISKKSKFKNHKLFFKNVEKETFLLDSYYWSLIGLF